MKNIIIFCFPFFNKNMYLVALVVFLNPFSGCLPRGDYTVIKLSYVAVWSKFIRLIIPYVFFMMIIYSPNIIEGFGYKGTSPTGKRDTCMDSSPAVWQECARGYWNTGVCACVHTQSPLTLQPHGLTRFRGVFQARILECIAIFFSKGFSWPRDRTQVSCIAGGFFTIWATRSP